MFFEIVLCVDLFLLFIALLLVAYGLKSLEDCFYEEVIEENEVLS